MFWIKYLKKINENWIFIFDLFQYHLDAANVKQKVKEIF